MSGVEIEHSGATATLWLNRPERHNAFDDALISELSAALEGIAQSYSNTLVALVHALDAREHETSDHSQRVVRYTVAIARRMTWSVRSLTFGASLRSGVTSFFILRIMMRIGSPWPNGSSPPIIM